MNKLIVILLASSLGFLAACGSDGKDSNNPTAGNDVGVVSDASDGPDVVPGTGTAPDTDANTGGTGSGSDVGGTGSDVGTTPGTGFSTGFPKDKKLSELSPAEQEQAMAAGQEYMNSPAVKTGMCDMNAMFAIVMNPKQPATEAELQVQCAAAHQECMSEPLGGDNADTLPAQCDATIGETEACVNDQFAEMKAATSKAVPCKDMTIEFVKNFDITTFDFGDDSQEGLSTACQIVEDKCPGFFDDEDEDEGDF